MTAPVYVHLPYGSTIQSAEVSCERVIADLGKVECRPVEDVTRELERALANPVGPALDQVVSRGDRVLILTVDHTRPNPAPILWPLVERIESLGARAEILIGLGNHRPMSPEELERFLGLGHAYHNDARSPEQWRLGATRHGTPIEVSPILREADRRIVVGFIEPHYIAGFSGGRKMILPGCASHAATTRNHFLTLIHGPQLGRLEGNPVHEDMVEAARAVGVDWICDAVVNPDDTFHSIHCGHLLAAHEQGVRMARALYSRTVPHRADIVLCSPGGAPYDVDMVQAKKALVPALECVRPGGVVILLGECPRRWGAYDPDRDLLHPDTVLEVRKAIAGELARGELSREWPRCSPGLLFARLVYDAGIHLIIVSSLAGELEDTYLQTAPDLASALQMAEERLGPEATITLIPDGRRALCRCQT